MRDYILYKNPVQYDTLAIVRYIYHAKGIDARPKACIERCHPEWATSLPSIETSNGERYIGFDECIEFYESIVGEDDLLEKVNMFNCNKNI